MSGHVVSAEVLARLEPLNAASASVIDEISRMCYVETISRNLDPFRLKGPQGQVVYLLKGELKVDYPDSSMEVLVGGAGAALVPLGRRRQAIAGSKAITDIELIRIDEEMLDILLTWDQLAEPASDVQTKQDEAADRTDWRLMSGMFAARVLAEGAFAAFPPAHIDELLRRFSRVKKKRGEIILREGEEGDRYYLIEKGRCTVSRLIGGAQVEIAELRASDAFGEEALVANTRRNATVSMKTDGTLLQLDKQDFIELLQEPLLHRLAIDEAQKMLSGGAVLIDVRFPAEYNSDKIEGAINIPLNEIRNAFASLDRDKAYIVYCRSGRRSSAAAFLLAQRGFKAYLLEGGLRT